MLDLTTPGALAQLSRQIKIEPTHVINIYLSGSINIIEQTCRKYCLEKGFCVTVSKTKFIYTGGEETGVVVGLLNYPKFPSELNELKLKSEELALLLLEESFQHSILIVSEDESKWISARHE